MSKEMDLLKRILATGWLDHELSCEVEELLTQLEQSSTTRHALDSYCNQEAYQRGYAQAKLDLKREPLSAEEIEDIYEEHSFTIDAFARAIEKAHGITGGGE